MVKTRTKRSRAQLRGDPTESARLRPLFLAWVANRTVKAACAAEGLPYSRIATWLGNELAVLGDDIQQSLRTQLGLGAP